MKIITAVIRPPMLGKVTNALEEIDGFPGMTVTDVRGFGCRTIANETDAPSRILYRKGPRRDRRPR